MESDIHVLVATPHEGEFDLIQARLAQFDQYICHWQAQLPGLDKLIATNEFQLLLLQHHWLKKTSQMLLYRLNHLAKPIPVVVFTEFQESDLDDQLIAAGADDYFSLDNLTNERLDRLLRHAVIRCDYEQRLVARAKYDQLCGIASREKFNDRLNHAVNVNRRNRSRFAVALVDINQFKHVNDQHGKAIGDQALVEVAKRLQQAVRDSDSVARLASDEFIVLAEGIDSQEGIEALAEKLVRQIKNPIVLGNITLELSLAVGVAVFPDSGDDADSLLAHVDQALQEAKSLAGNNYSIHQRQNGGHQCAGEDLHGDLLRAIKRNDLRICYQPRVDINSGKITAVEALLRWPHPEKGLLAPAEFFPMAKSKGLISTLGFWVLQEAVSQWQHLNLSLDQPIGLVVNVAPTMLAEVKMIDKLRVCADKSADGQLIGLELEVDQSAWLKQGRCIEALSLATEKMGVVWSVDGVGKGYLPLGDIASRAVQSLVIDRAVIAQSEIDDNTAALVKGLVALGDSLNKQIVAQGVENLPQMRLLQGWGCHLVQGYFTSSPLTLGDLRVRLLQQKRGQLTFLG